MTGCDLRYLVGEMIRENHARIVGRYGALNTRIAEVNQLADTLGTLELFADLATAVRQLAIVLGEEATQLHIDACTCRDAAVEAVEKVRAHFHEVVDERVESRAYRLDEEAVEEKIREAVEEAIESFRSNAESNVCQAIRDTEAD